MKRVYCLYRVSTLGQVEKEDIPMQRGACRDFAKAKGWIICEEFSKKGVSGFSVPSDDRETRRFPDSTLKNETPTRACAWRGDREFTDVTTDASGPAYLTGLRPDWYVGNQSPGRISSERRAAAYNPCLR